jgi:hypothetical protein
MLDMQGKAITTTGRLVSLELYSARTAGQYDGYVIVYSSRYPDVHDTATRNYDNLGHATLRDILNNVSRRDPQYDVLMPRPQEEGDVLCLLALKPALSLAS